MTVHSVPASHGAELARAVNRAVEGILLDVHRRAHGAAPLIPDEWIEPAKTGDVCVVIGLATDTLATGIVASQREREARRRRHA